MVMCSVVGQADVNNPIPAGDRRVVGQAHKMQMGVMDMSVVGCAATSVSRVQVMDMFVEQTHNIETQMRDGEKPMRFTDTRLDEQERGVSLKMVPMSLVMEGTSGKSYLMNLIDTPGTLRASSLTGPGQ